jgi:release factor glutamine methyltransferase
VTSTTTTLKELVEAGTRELRDAAGAARENPRREAAILLQAAVGLDRTHLLKHGDEVVPPPQMLRYWSMVRHRVRGIPLQLILGETPFHDVVLCVESGVFIPRPETEVLVEEAAKSVEDLLEEWGGSADASICVLDIGTGTGAIAVALAAKYANDPEVRVYGADWNPRAVRLARHNARKNGVGGRVEFRRSNLFSAFADLERKVDVLLSNPPYISPDESETLPIEVRLGDPREALFDPDGGTGFHRRIALRGRDFLKPGGTILMEIGQSQGRDVQAILHRIGYSDVEVLPDLAGRDRIVRGRLLY